MKEKTEKKKAPYEKGLHKLLLYAISQIHFRSNHSGISKEIYVLLYKEASRCHIRVCWAVYTCNNSVHGGYYQINPIHQSVLNGIFKLYWIYSCERNYTGGEYGS